MKFSQLFFFSIISSISCAPVNPAPLLNVADNAATAAARPALTRSHSTLSRLGDGIPDVIHIPVVEAIPDNAATAAARPGLSRGLSAPAFIDTTRIPNPKIEEAAAAAAAELAAKNRREKITVGLLAGGVGGLSGGLIGAAATN